jgi:hypothetical protein
MRELVLTEEDAAHILDRVRAGCVDDGGCLIWQGCVKKNSGLPLASIRPWVGVTLPRLLFQARHGRPPIDGLCVVPLCGNRRCLGCLAEVTRREAQRLASQRGAYSHPVAQANRTAANRKRARYAAELIEVARDRSLASPEAARRTGISPSYVRSLRVGTGRVSGLGVWAGLLA